MTTSLQNDTNLMSKSRPQTHTSCTRCLLNCIVLHNKNNIICAWFPKFQLWKEFPCLKIPLPVGALDFLMDKEKSKSNLFWPLVFYATIMHLWCYIVTPIKLQRKRTFEKLLTCKRTTKRWCLHVSNVNFDLWNVRKCCNFYGTDYRARLNANIARAPGA